MQKLFVFDNDQFSQSKLSIVNISLQKLFVVNINLQKSFIANNEKFSVTCFEQIFYQNQSQKIFVLISIDQLS